MFNFVHFFSLPFDTVSELIMFNLWQHTLFRKFLVLVLLRVEGFATLSPKWSG